MAITLDALIGSTSISTGGSAPAITTSSAVASGGKVCLGLNWFGAQTLNSVSGGGLTWRVEKQGISGAGVSCAIASADAPSGLATSTAITGTMSAGVTAGFEISVISFLGCPLLGADSTNSHAFASGTAWDTNAVSPVGADAVILAVAGIDDGGTSTSTTTAPATEAYDLANATTTMGYTMAYRIVTGGGPITVAGVWGTSGATVMCVGVSWSNAGASPVNRPLVSIPFQSQGRNL